MFNRLRNSILTVVICLSSIQAATVSGTVTDSANGSAVVNVQVQIRSGNRTIATDTTNELGTYSLTVANAGNYSIRVSNANYTAKTVTATVGASALVVNIPIVKIVSTTISGTITDSVSGAPVTGAVVRLGYMWGGVSDTTGADGMYSLTGVTSGRQTLQISASGYSTLSTTATVISDPVIENIKLLAIILSTINGVVTDSISGTPIAGAIVRLGNNRGAATDTTGIDGTYSFAEVTSGTKTIRVSDSGYITKLITTAVISSAPATANVTLVKIVTASISGVVSNNAGVPLSGVVVWFGTGRQGASDTTGADGAYSFAEVSSGTYQIQATLRGYATQFVNASVVTETPVTVNITMFTSASVTVTGIVTDAISGTPLAGVAVRLGAGRQTTTDTTGADGVYSFDSVSNSNQTLRLTKSSYTTKNVTITFSGANPETFNITLLPIGSAVRSTLNNYSTESLNFDLSKAGILSLTNISGAGNLEVISLNGTMLFRSSFPAGSSSLTLPEAIVSNSSRIIVTITADGKSLTRSIIPFNR